MTQKRFVNYEKKKKARNETRERERHWTALRVTSVPVYRFVVQLPEMALKLTWIAFRRLSCIGCLSTMFLFKKTFSREIRQNNSWKQLANVSKRSLHKLVVRQHLLGRPFTTHTLYFAPKDTRYEVFRHYRSPREAWDFQPNRMAGNLIGHCGFSDGRTCTQ